MAIYTAKSNGWLRWTTAVVAASVVTIGWMPQASTQAPNVNSGSDESDGPLVLAGGLPTIVFDPADKDRWGGRVLDADGDGVFNFTTISIGAGTILKFRGDVVNRPIYFLASGDVVIDGTLDLSGAAGFVTGDLGLRRQLTVPGSGGFAGGAGGFSSCLLPAATAGDGPGGGAAPVCNGNPSHGGSGGFSGNRYLLPLIGGSGGGGALSGSFANGGAGGGAILIASSTSVALAGVITSVGGAAAVAAGNVACSGNGSGGAIRLIAPTISGSGQLNVLGGPGVPGQCGGGTRGLVRLEAYSISGTLVFNAGSSAITQGTPVDETTFRPSYQLRVTSIAGVAVPQTPSGSFVAPDVPISSSSAVPVVIEATGIPHGTVVTLEVFPQAPENPQVVKLPPVQATLTGTLQHSTATVNFVFPYGFSRGTIRATWSQ